MVNKLLDDCTISIKDTIFRSEYTGLRKMMTQHMQSKSHAGWTLGLPSFTMHATSRSDVLGTGAWLKRVISNMTSSEQRLPYDVIRFWTSVHDKLWL